MAKGGAFRSVSYMNTYIKDAALCQRRGRVKQCQLDQNQSTFQEKKEGSTNYRRRLALVKSGKNRVVIRKSLNNIIVQIVSSNYEEIKQLQLHFRRIERYGMEFTAVIRLCISYRYLCGKRAKKLLMSSY